MGRPLLPYAQPCVPARLVRRENRFVMVVETNRGLVKAHCNNSGSMLGLLRPGADVLLSPATNATRLLRYTLEAIHGNGQWIGVNTMTPNRLLEAAFYAGRLTGARHYEFFQREVKRKESRFDARLTGSGLPPLWVEAKNVTLVEEDVAYFPDAETERGRKHLLELMDVVRSGECAAMFFLVQRGDGGCFAPADFVDARYADLLAQARDKGVMLWVRRGVVDERGVDLGPALPLAAF